MSPRQPKSATVAVQADDGGMDVFLQRIKRQGLLANLDRTVHLPGPGAQADQRFQAGERQFPQSLPFKQERGKGIRVVKIDLGQIVAAVDFNGPFQILPRPAADQLFENHCVHFDGVRVQANRGPIGQN